MQNHPEQEKIIYTSGQRLNCSFHSTLLSLFDYLLHKDTSIEDIHKVIDNKPYSFLAFFNEIHHCTLTVEEFIMWVKSHKSGDQYDANFIQMLAPCLRKQVYTLHDQRVLFNPEIPSSEIEENAFKDRTANQNAGNMREAVFNYIYAILGIPIYIYSPDERGFAAYNADENFLGYYFATENKLQPNQCSLYIAQNPQRTHFSSLGALIKNQDHDSSLSYINDDVSYQAVRSRALQIITSVERADYVEMAIQEDINRFFNAERCIYPHNIPPGVSVSQIISGELDNEAIQAAANNIEIDVEFIKQFSFNLEDNECDLIARYIKSRVSSHGALDSLKKSLAKEKIKYGHIILDVLLALTILGLPYVIISHINDERRFSESRKTDQEIIKMISRSTKK